MLIEGKKKTTVVECRLDIRILASIHRYYLNEGLVPSTRSELLRQSLKLLAEILHSQGKIESWSKLSNEEATQTLKEFTELSIQDQRIRIMAKSIPQDKVKPIEEQFIAATDQALAVVDIAAAKKAMEFINRGTRLTVPEWDSLPNEAQNLIPFELHPDRFAYLDSLKNVEEQDEVYLPPVADLFKGKVV